MFEIIGNIFFEIGKANALCITTNGVLRSNGYAICGAGIAKAARNRWDQFELLLGQQIKINGNRVNLVLTDHGTSILSFPTKNHWKDISDIKIIEKSCKELLEFSNTNNWNRIVVPRPGCLNGQLEWNNVKVILNSYFDDRFIVYNNENK